MESREMPRFGRTMRQEFLLNPNFTLMDHGAYGNAPKATLKALQEFQYRAEANPDLWMRREAKYELKKVRELLGKIVNASAEDIVMVIDTTSAMNAIFRSTVFELGERILHVNTIYDSMDSLIKFICDYSKGAVSALTFNVTYPISNDEIVKNFEEFLETHNDPSHPIRIALIDHISSSPGAIFPIDKVIPLLKACGITVIVDGAHAIGQIPINIATLAPDYYISNCHKWLYAYRGCAMMYVDKKHQQTIHPAHISSRYSQPSNFQEEFFWTETRQYPQFGRSMRQEFLLNPDFTLLNHGSYGKLPPLSESTINMQNIGTYPKATREALHQFQYRAEANPDLWIRREARFEMDKVRELLAKLVNASAEDIVMIINTTSAMNAIFRSMVFGFGERILHFNTIYGSMESLIKYICDYSNGAVTALTFDVTYPISNDQIVENFRQFLEDTHDPAHPIRIALIDHITSVPGAIVPIERIIPLLKARNITVLIDGAHAIGQIPINITALAPDYYITNCHKWLYASRGCAMMYVDKNHQATIHPAHINSGYSQPSNFQEEFFWTVYELHPCSVVKMAVLQIFLLLTTLVVAVIAAEVKFGNSRQYPTFGRAMREEFLMNPQFTLLDHGAYGTSPKVTLAALHEYQNRAEANPDLWIRRDVEGELYKVRELLGKLVNASAEDIVMIINTTNAMNAIFRSMVFGFGERILHFSTIYGSMESLIKYICDYSNGAVSALSFFVTYPISNDQIVDNFRQFLEDTHDPAHPIRVALIDHITSVPGAIVPIERIIPLLKARNITVLIDGAHAIGQIPINITALAPDYYITNCHKWLYASRGCAMMYVDKKHQGTIHPAHINSGYSQPASYQGEFAWTGTMDFSPYMTVPAALKFREDVGGEEAIMSYNHRLALDGGFYMASVLGTEIIQAEDQIGNMVDVRLPIIDPDDARLNTNFWIDTLLYRFPHIFAPVYKHGGKWWIRISCQIYNDLSDFEVLAKVYQTICDELNGNNSTVANFSI
ncbi:Hercynylcysteine sulfoxide lyase, partial [Pseudolycoriella hygida]